MIKAEICPKALGTFRAPRVLVAIIFFCPGVCLFHSHVKAFLSPTQTSCCYHPKTHTRRNGVQNYAALNKSGKGNATTATTESSPDPLLLLPQLYTYQKPRQKRQPRSTRARKPRFYWQSIDNLRSELCLFWDDLNVDIQPDQPPPIPSEYLLNHFNRNDLRWGLSQMGGRENVAHILGGAKIIPGRWKDAIELDEVKQLLPMMEKQGLGKSKRKEATSLSNVTTLQNKRRSMMQQPHRDQSQVEDSSTQLYRVEWDPSTMAYTPVGPTEDGYAKEFWSKERAIKELYQYLEVYRKDRQRPAVWTPQLSELSQEGYSRLFNACSRFQDLPSSNEKDDDDDDIHSIAGLVPFKEWRFFESQLQLFVELQHYLRLYHNGSEALFPDPSVVLGHGHNQLYDLIRIHGGKTMLAQKLDMKFAWDTHNTTAWNGSSSSSSHNTNNDLSWGAFTLEFAIQLLHFIRSQYLTLDPPLSSTHISMPSQKDLLSCGHDQLAKQVILFGGYENVARRLGLAYFDGMSQQMDERRFLGAKKLWKNRHRYLRKDKIGRKRKGLPWNEELVIRELHEYVKVNMTKRSYPPTVMPRFRHLDEDDRGDLRRAMSKFGGVKHFHKASGLIPIEVWQKSQESN